MQSAFDPGQPLNDALPPERSAAREGLLVFAGAIALMLVQLLPLRSLSMLNRLMWLDECVTDLIVTAPDARNAYVTLLAGGIDANPPTYYALMRALRSIGLHGPEVYRTVAMLCVAGAIAGIYALLRRSFDRYSAAAGALGLWTIGLAVEHTFEARFYALLLLATVWFAYFAHRCDRSRWRQIMLAATAVVACTTHWFGIIGVLLVLAGEVIARWRARRPIAPLWPASFGAIALLACLPLLIAQKRAIGAETFLSGNPIRAAYAYYAQLLPGTAVAALGLVAVTQRLAAGNRHEAADCVRLAPQLGLLMLVLMPVMLVAISLLLQPVMQLRYAIVATAAMTVPIAFAASLIHRSAWRALAAVALVLVMFHTLFRVWVEKKAFADDLNALSAVIRAEVAQGRRAVFESRHDLYPLAWLGERNDDRMAYFAERMPDESPLRSFERGMALRVDGLAKWPVSIGRPSLGTSFIFIADNPDAARVMRAFPTASVEPLGGRAFRVTP